MSIKYYLKNKLSPNSIHHLMELRSYGWRAIGIFMYPYARFISTPYNLSKNENNKERQLEIGPGPTRVPGFETINVVWGKEVDYIGDASKKMPFASGTFDLVFASHVLEHMPWFQLESVVQEWSRIVKPGGCLEIWVPDGLKLSQFICDIENGKRLSEWDDNWRPFNKECNPYKWANGRLLYGIRGDYPSWHRSIVTPVNLRNLLESNGFRRVEQLTQEDVRGYDHGWINLGMRGYKL